jgi:alkylation response protein AidB-like acyl-CoA dehydrogenase
MWRLTDEQRAFRERLRAVVLEEIRPRVLEIDEHCDYPHDVHQTLADAGLLALAVPRAEGGRGESEVSFCAFVEELAKVSGTISLMAAYVKLVALPIVLAGTEEQKRRYLPPLINGERYGSYALTEPSVGSDPAALETRAERHGDVWVLNGRKRFIGNAGLGDLYVVFARTGAPGSRGISAFVVDGRAPGITVERLRTMGMPGWQLGAPRFEDVEVPAANLLGREGDGFKIAMNTLDISRLGIASQAVGIAQGALDAAAAYAADRRQFGQRVADFQGIQFMLADMASQTEAARQLTYAAAARLESRTGDMAYWSSCAKLIAGDTAMRVTTDAVQVLGGYGYITEYPVERMMRDAKITQLYEGTQQIQRLLIARRLLERAGVGQRAAGGAGSGAGSGAAAR